MIMSVMVEFHSRQTQVVEPTRPVPGQNPQVSMHFKTVPAVGHVIEAPNKNLSAAFYRVALVLHTIHGDIIIKVIPV